MVELDNKTKEYLNNLELPDEIQQLPQEAQMNILRSFLANNMERPQQISNNAQQNKQHFADYDFSGGLNVDSAAEHLKRSELRQADDLVITKRGGIKKREGLSTYHSTAYDNITQLIKWPRKDGTKQLLAVVLDVAQYKLYDATNTTEIQNVDSSQVGYLVFQDKFYFLDGNEFYKYDGSTVSALAANDKDVYFYIDDQEGDFEIDENIEIIRLYVDPNSYSDSFIKGEEITGLTSGATASLCSNYQGSQVLDVYDRTGTFNSSETIKGSNSEVQATLSGFDSYYYKGIIKNIVQHGTQAILAINNITNHPYLGPNPHFVGLITQSIAHIKKYADDFINDLDSIKKCKFATRHTNSYRFFYAGNNEDRTALYYSEYNQPGFVKTTSVLYPTEAEGPIVGINEMMGYLIVSYENGDWVYTGIDPAQDAQWQKIPTRHGAHNENVITLTQNSLTTYGDDGVYVKNPSILGQDDNMVPGENFIVNIAKDKVESILDDVTNPGVAAAVYDPDESIYYLAFCDDSSGTNNKILVYNWVLQAFTQWTGLNINDFLYYESGTLLGAQGSNIVQINGGGYGGTYTLKTKKYFLEAPFHNKQIEKIYIALENPQEVDYSVDVTLILDNAEVKTETVDVPNPGPETYIASINVRDVGSRIQIKVVG